MLFFVLSIYICFLSINELTLQLRSNMAVKQYKGIYWNEILTTDGAKMWNKNWTEICGIWTTGNTWNHQDLNNELTVGDVFSTSFSPYRYKVFSSGIAKTANNEKVTYKVSVQNDNGLLFRWKGIIMCTFILYLYMLIIYCYL